MIYRDLLEMYDERHFATRSLQHGLLMAVMIWNEIAEAIDVCFYVIYAEYL